MSERVAEVRPNTARDAHRAPRGAVDPATGADRLRRPTAVDLFSGVGGLSLGFEQAGFDVLAAVEHDPRHANAHRYNFPLAHVLEADAAAVTAADVRHAAALGYALHGRPGPWDGGIDVVFGGPPCQGFSVGGRRASGDERNELVFAFAELVCELEPRYFLMENVPGMLGDAHADWLDWLIGRLRGWGYVVADRPTIVNAADYGVPQNRRRVILMGWRPGEHPVVVPTRPARLMEMGEPAPAVRPAPSAAPTVRDAIGDLPDPQAHAVLFASDAVRIPEPAFAPAPSTYARTLRGEDADDLAYPRLWDRSLLTASGRTAHTAAAVRRFRRTPAGKTEPISHFRRLEWDGLCSTLRSGTGPERGGHTPPRPIHPDGHRVITVREAARLHSFPDWFRFHVTRWHAWRQLGNSVPPLLGRAFAAAIADALDITPVRPERRISLGSSTLLGYVSTPDGGEPVPPRRARAQPREARAPLTAGTR